MTKFIFFWRLVEEKWVEIILDVFTMLYKHWIRERTLDIYGAWQLEKLCEWATEKHPDNIYFHGWGEHKHVMSMVKEKDFCLMPSLVIESFWLTALESLCVGVPVIGFKKWGVEPFISDKLDIETQHGKTYADKLFNLISHILSEKKEKSSYLPRVDFSKYSQENWLSEFKKISGDTKRILLVSDFTKRVGGVENYIHDLRDLLLNHGYTVELRWMDKKNSFWGLFKTALNISAWLKLWSKIDSFKPDLVRTHSVMREIGWFPLTVIPKDTPLLTMFHDLGYFNPYPARVYNVPDAKKINKLSDWLRIWAKKNKLTLPLVFFKRLSLRAIRSVFRNHQTTYLVPSAFMAPLSEVWRQGKDQKTIVLPHFVK